MMYFADTSRGRPFAKDPAVVRMGDRYLMYYSMCPYGDGREADGFGIGVAESADLDDWTKVGEIAPQQACEEKGICAPGAIALDNIVHLFYQTYGNRENDAICHATSTDGLSFERNPTNPIVKPTGDWNCGRAIDADVIDWNGELLLYWATRDRAYRLQLIGVSSAPLNSGFSRDQWTQRCDSPILGPELDWEQECIEASAVCKRDGRLWQFYAGAYNNCPQQIGCAVSDDGISWTRVSDQPLLPNGEPGSWNSSESGHPYVFVDNDGTTHLFYQGNNDNGKTWYLSRVTIDWSSRYPQVSV
jgi:sucrose-6-phosphate hydrolase SacC (GH32 family)